MMGHSLFARRPAENTGVPVFHGRSVGMPRSARGHKTAGLATRSTRATTPHPPHAPHHDQSAASSLSAPSIASDKAESIAPDRQEPDRTQDRPSLQPNSAACKCPYAQDQSASPGNLRRHNQLCRQADGSARSYYRDKPSPGLPASRPTHHSTWEPAESHPPPPAPRANIRFGSNVRSGFRFHRRRRKFYLNSAP